MPNFLLYLSLFGLALILVALGYGARIVTERARAQARAVANLERALTFQQNEIDELKKRAQPASKHDLLYLARHDAGEAVMFDLARARDAVELLQHSLEYAAGRAAHVASGGSPDDPPTMWGNGETK